MKFTVWDVVSLTKPEKSEIVTYQRSRFWWRQSYSQSVDGDEGAFEPLHFAVYEQLWLTYKTLRQTAGVSVSANS